MKLSGRLLLTTLAVAAIAAAQDDPPGRVGRISFMSGAVSFQPGGVDDWVTANLNRPLTNGDHLWVDQNGRLEVQLGSASLRMGARTAFEVLNLTDQAAQIRLAEGSLEIRLRFLDENETFEVDTPNVAFSLLRPGTYRIDANPDSQTTIITARTGEGEATGGGQAFSVKAREQARVTGDQAITYNMAAAPPPDWFDDWCSSRDRIEDTSQSARYVPRGMIGYADLDAAGDWRPVPEYGNVWYPRAMPAGWAPYRYGHWAWIEPWGWTWVDDAAWGFAPFHYGRWAHIGGGWGWVPGPPAVRPVYAPALVAFVGGPHFSLAVGAGGAAAGIAWFPLGPREVYVPSYRVSPAYVTRVNTSNTVINNVTVMNVYNNTNVTNIRYVNQTAPGGVTAVPHEAFVGARSVGQARVEVSAQMIASSQVVRTAAIAPSRESVMGHATVVATTARPPQAIYARSVVAKSTPPPPPVPFAQRQQLLQRNPGQPLESNQVQTIRSQSPATAHPFVRPMNAAQVNQAQPQANPQPRPAFANPNRPAITTPAPQNQPQRQIESAQPRAAEPASINPNRPAVTTPAPQNQPQRQIESAQPRAAEPASINPNRPAVTTPAPQNPPQRQIESAPPRRAEPDYVNPNRPTVTTPAPQNQPQRQIESAPPRRAEPAERVVARPTQAPPKAQAETKKEDRKEGKAKDKEERK